MTPSLSGRIVRILLCVFSCMFMALVPTASSSRVFLSMATIDGSSTTTSLSYTISVFAVPKSIASSCLKKLNIPIKSSVVVFLFY